MIACSYDCRDTIGRQQWVPIRKNAESPKQNTWVQKRVGYTSRDVGFY